MLIIGGTYQEVTEEPRSDRIYGSALRGAAALCNVCRPRVITCVDKGIEDVARSLASAYNFDLTLEERQQPISFHWLTPINSPDVYGSEQARCDLTAINNDEDSVLIYGMLEAQPTVFAKGIVYDPQGKNSLSDLNKVKFSSDRLAIVGNSYEIRSLGKSPIIADAAARILKDTEADVVVVKCGALGCRVIENNGVDTPVGCYRTGEVWPIGSGDVFSAVFAWSWLEDNQEAVQAAQIASAATAVWCGTQTLPVDLMSNMDPASLGVGTLMAPQEEKVPVYLAGPFFDLSSRWLINTTRRALDQLGARVFSPMHDVGIGKDEVAIKDIEGLIKSKSVLGLLDNDDPGTMTEMGYAASKGIPTIGYASNPHSSKYIMLRGLGVSITDDLSTAVYHAIWAGMKTA